MIGNLIGVLFDGIAYGSLLFVISIGLSVTMGLMNFVNLAHGAFAMLGGYACVVLMTRAGVPFLATLPVAFLVPAVAGIVLERTLYQRLYKATHLDQVMFSIGLVFMSVAAATWFFGPSQQPVRLPDFLRGQVRVLGLDLGAYRLFLIGVVVVITMVLTMLLVKTRFGAQVRASVDNAVAAAGLGIDVNRVFGVTFALGFGPRGSRRRPRHRRARARSDVPAQVHGVLPARRGDRRRRHDQGRPRRRDDPRHLRRRRQVLRAADRLVHHLLPDGRADDPVPGGPVRAASMTTRAVARPA